MIPIARGATTRGPPARIEMKRPKDAPESATRERIVQAALETLGEEGFAGTTARAIAKHGGFNQALIFYHFGSVNGLLLDAYRKLSEDQIAKYRAAAGDVSSLADLVQIARRLHDDDMRSGSITAVIQLMASSVSDPEIARIVLERFDAWIAVVEEAVRRATEGHPLNDLVPVRESAYAISALFLGIELMSRLDPNRADVDRVFDMMGGIAALIEHVAPMLGGSS
jgi:AcrR family transcriptional regulator